jgi:amidase
VTSLHELTARETAAAVVAGEVSAVEVCEPALARAEALDARLGVFVTRTPDLALAQARAADAVAAAARADGTTEQALAAAPLLGVPCPVKDLEPVAGVPMTLGSAAFADLVPEADSGVVTLLRRAGAVMLGKTTTPELGLPCYTESDVAPPARTPWDETRGAGGSSGGAAVAVAAGIAPVAHASDGGGSIRIPASCCGLVGLKPARGRVSPGPLGVDVSGLGVSGGLSRDVRDTALLLDVLAHAWPGDLHHVPPPRSSFLQACDRDPGRLRIGVLTSPAIVSDAPVDPACLAAVADAAGLLADLGHDVVDAPRPFDPARWEAFADVWSVLALLAPVPPTEEHRLRPLSRWLRDRGRRVSAEAYVTAQLAIQLLTRDVAAAWDGLDLVLTPTLAALPAPVASLCHPDDPAADFAAQTRFTPWTSVANLTGLPAVSLPLHWTEAGDVTLPVGVMLFGPPWGEELLLAVAAQLEAARPWAGRRPPCW